MEAAAHARKFFKIFISFILMVKMNGLQKVGNFLLIRQTDKSWGLYNNYELTLGKSSFII
jgi:hypothetical protein